tara:strand:+ start:1702 stop:2394 length:693 start_codon:yes stop_codon:yes gene_type:complete
MKMSKYFSDARETANESFNSMDGSEFLNANGGSSAGLGGATSQPYILNIANSTSSAVTNVVVGGAYTNLNATNFGNVAAITITMGIANLTYTEFLYQSMNKPFVVGLMYLSSANASQVLETLTIKQKDINGNESSKVIVPTLDPYQQQGDKIAISFNWKFDGFTSVTIASLLASATLKAYLYPAENVSTGRALTGGSVVKGFASPDIVKKDKVEVIGGGGRSLGMNARRF